VGAEIDLSVVVPAYNEAERLPKTLRRLHQYLIASPFRYEILIVLDGPTDNTPEVLHRISSEISNLRIIDRTVNRGKGYTIKEGILNCAGRIRLFTDADDSTDIAHLDLMLPLFDQGYDLVIASRNAKDAAGAIQVVPQPFYRWFLGRVGNFLVQRLLFRGLWDTHCGFKAFRGDVAERIFANAEIDGWGFDIEVLALAQAMQYKIGIIPAHWINDRRSHMGMLSYLQALKEILRLSARMRRFRIDQDQKQTLDGSSVK